MQLRKQLLLLVCLVLGANAQYKRLYLWCVVAVFMVCCGCIYGVLWLSGEEHRIRDT